MLANVVRSSDGLQRSADCARTGGSAPHAPGNLRHRGCRSGCSATSAAARSSRDSARRAWARARLSALTEKQVNSPLARRPYNLRHAAASLWLNKGVPATEVARQLGYGVAVLLKIYADCIDGQVSNRIAAALAVGQDREALPRRRPWTLQPSQTRGPEPTR
jgi:hypothetical protein